MFNELKGQTALITGAAKRIGRETALTLADRGINLVIHFNRSDTEARQLVGQLQQKGVKAWIIQVDFRRPDEYQTLIERARQTAGGLDILINNASISPPGKDESYLQSLVHTVPPQRHGAPQDIADTIAFLIQSEFITGQVIYVDGGRHLHEYSNGSHPH